MLDVQALDSSLENSLENSLGRDSSLKVGLEQDLKLMDLANAGVKEHSSSEILEAEEGHDTEMKLQSPKALSSLSLPSGQVLVREELGLG
jgi:hypothetical protein